MFYSLTHTKHFKILIFFLCGICIASLILFTYPLFSTQTKTLSVYLIDVGQGEAIYIDLFGKKSVLIDTGTKEEFDNFFQQLKKKRGIKAFLKKHDIKKIDLLIISHPHSDHIGSLYSVLQFVDVKEVLDPGYAHPSMLYNKCLKLIEKKKITYKIARTGMKYFIEGVHFEILNPPRIYRYTNSDANSNSIVMKMTYKNISFLFTGDIYKNVENKLLAFGEKLKSTFLKVAHQGSDSSSSDKFIKLVNPKAVFISCGKHNDFGHPSLAVLKRFKKLNALIYRTDLHGTIKIETNGSEFQIITEVLKNN